MKVVVTKFVCDVCGKELNVNTNERHYTISFGTSNTWSDDVDTFDTMVTKDICSECYKTVLSLTNEYGQDKKNLDMGAKKGKDNRYATYDKELIKTLWGRRLTYKEITEQTGASRNQINYVVTCMTEEEKQEVRRNAHEEDVDYHEEEPISTMKAVVDENGYVISVE